MQGNITRLWVDGVAQSRDAKFDDAAEFELENQNGRRYRARMTQCGGFFTARIWTVERLGDESPLTVGQIFRRGQKWSGHVYAVSAARSFLDGSTQNDLWNAAQSLAS